MLDHACSRSRQKTKLFAASLAALVLQVGCAHEVEWLGEAQASWVAPARPVRLTVGVRAASFEASAVEPPELLARFAARLGAAGLFRDVLYPVPDDRRPMWEITLVVTEPEAEAERSACGGVLAQAFLALRGCERDYTLAVKAFLTKGRRVLQVYESQGAVRYRYQPLASQQKMEREGLDLVLDRSLDRIVADIAADLPAIALESRLRSGH